MNHQDLLVGDELVACEHRLVLRRVAGPEVSRRPDSPENQRRRRDARALREAVASRWSQHHGARSPLDHDDVATILGEGPELLLRTQLPVDEAGRRRSVVDALVRTGRDGANFTYAPVLIKNIEVTTPASTTLLRASGERLEPAFAEAVEGLGVRKSVSVRRALLSLGQATRLLELLGHADADRRVGLVDRRGQLWWFSLTEERWWRFNLRTYDRQYESRRTILERLEEWRRDGGALPTTPYWHKECEECEFAPHCEAELRQRDDVSLVRFTNAAQQTLLRERSIDTRADLARLSPRAVRHALAGDESDRPLVELTNGIERLEDLIYRARVTTAGSLLRRHDPRDYVAVRADIEVDIDMESYDDVTYLWGAHVHLRRPHETLREGYYPFVNWGPLDAGAEARLFADFWAWFNDLRQRAAADGFHLRAYCFWAHAENSAMNRAVESPLEGGPRREDLDAFRDPHRGEWVDMHKQVQRYIQTDGPTGLKQMAQAAGFHWRDEAPSGEASMLWYEIARGDTEAAAGQRARLLAYNEDDCLATLALREWLDGPAQQLPHRDEVFGP